MRYEARPRHMHESGGRLGCAWSDHVAVAFWNEIFITQNMHPTFLLEVRSREDESSSDESSSVQSLKGKGGGVPSIYLCA
jgi:hypothetical protein